MLIHINDDMRLEEINDHFNLCFPYLQLEFYHGVHHIHASSDETKAIDQKMRVGEVSRRHIQATIEINSGIKVGELEARFKHEFGLHIQVLWKNGDEWQQTTAYDDLSLSSLNELGEKSINH